MGRGGKYERRVSLLSVFTRRKGVSGGKDRQTPECFSRYRVVITDMYKWGDRSQDSFQPPLTGRKGASVGEPRRHSGSYSHYRAVICTDKATIQASLYIWWGIFSLSTIHAPPFKPVNEYNASKRTMMPPNRQFLNLGRRWNADVIVTNDCMYVFHLQHIVG